MSERRRVKRRHLLYYLRVHHARSARLLGHVVDITPGGVMLMSEHPIRLGRTIPLRMTLPGKLRGNETLEFEATSMWCRPDVNPDFWDTGFMAKDLTRRQLAAIETLIEDYGFRD